MQLNFKNYRIIKTKNYIKKENLYFFFNGITKDSNNWTIIEQNLKVIHFNYYKVFNQTSKKVFSHSIYKHTRWIINSITFLIKPNIKKLFKQTLSVNFDFILFNMLGLKINNKIYQTNQFKKNYSLNYKNNKKLVFQFKITSLRKLK